MIDITYVRFTDKSGRVETVTNTRLCNYGGLVALKNLAIEEASTGIVCVEIWKEETHETKT